MMTSGRFFGSVGSRDGQSRRGELLWSPGQRLRLRLPWPRDGAVAEWLGRGLQSLVHQFESGRRLLSRSQRFPRGLFAEPSSRYGEDPLEGTLGIANVDVAIQVNRDLNGGV